jgi:hypothetical protein
MPMKQRVRKDIRPRITPQTLAMWQVLREIFETPTDLNEDEPVGRRQEYIDLNLELSERLGLLFGTMIFPVEVLSPEPPGYMLHNGLLSDAWRNAYYWRSQLMAAEMVR